MNRKVKERGESPHAQGLTGSARETPEAPKPCGAAKAPERPDSARKKEPESQSLTALPKTTGAPKPCGRGAPEIITGKRPE